MFDSIRESLKHKPSLYATYDGRGSFINNEIAQVQSVKIGATFNRQFTLALGYNWLNSDFPRTHLDQEMKLRMRYGSAFAEYSFLEHHNVEVTIPVILGFGQSFLQNEAKEQYLNGFILTYEPSMTATWRVLKYFGVGGGVGYRLLLIRNSDLNSQFNSPTYLFRFKIFFGDLYKDFF